MFKKAVMPRDLEWGDGGVCRVISRPAAEAQKQKKISWFAKVWLFLAG